MSTVPMHPIRVLIADDHTYFRRALRRICEATEDLKVIGESENGGSAVAMADTLQPDVILMDIRMPVMNGITATNHIVMSNPVTRVVILTQSEITDELYEAVRAGARSYLTKETDAHVIIDTVRSVYRGEAVLSPSLLVQLFDSIHVRAEGSQPRHSGTR